MKIVMAGPSGSGKTTLAKFIGQELGIPFIENSAGLVMIPEDKQLLQYKYGYHGGWGQVGVINNGNKAYLGQTFGFDFQKAILRARIHLLSQNNDCVLDRSPLDPIVFFLNQCVHNYSDTTTGDFLAQCTRAIVEGGITHIVRIPLLDPKQKIENDGSRCSNYFFQAKIDKLFDLAIECLGPQQRGIHYHEVNTWNLGLRKIQVMQFLNQTISEGCYL